MTERDGIEPGLHLVSTPLGNLGDLSPRARETLSRASFIAGENTKVVLKWLEILSHDQVPEWKKPGVLGYRESSRDTDAQRILTRLEEQQAVALISDAGSPGISDPGWHLVELVRNAGFQVWAVPGPCAAILALSLSGFPSRRFSFEGFLPSSGRHRREALDRIKNSDSPCLLYESPHKFLDTLDALAELLPEREIFVAREMTKKFEENWRGALPEAVLAWKSKMIKGEFTLVVGPSPVVEDEESGEAPAESIDFIKELGLPTKTATQILKHFFPSASKKALYSELSQG